MFLGNQLEGALVQGDRLVRPGPLRFREHEAQLALSVAGFVQVICEDRGPLADPVAGGLFEQGGHRRVPLAPCRPRKRRVGDVADEHVLELELLVALEAGVGLAPDEIAPFQRVEQHRERRVRATKPRDRPAPEHLADNRGLEE